MKTLTMKMMFDPETKKISYFEIKDENEIIDGFEADEFYEPCSIDEIIEMLRENLKEMLI